MDLEGIGRLPLLRNRRYRTRALRTWRAMKRQRRLLAERLGSERYSTPALHDLDHILARYLPERGVFVEAGANDGYRQSNTYYLERRRHWSGLLVEPVPVLAKQAERERPNSKVVNAALVARDYDKPTIGVRYGGLISAVEGTDGWEDQELGEILDGASYTVAVPARTLSDLLDEAGIGRIDFLSLDVEGYEEQALGGLDLERHQPRFVLIEIWDAQARRAGIEELLGRRYRLVEQLTERDYLYSAEA
jgi:FkbM family methyltransferase